ncbi:hypothetical protein [Naumannella halotolerans]|uniref:Uncharacterized protein n=1 Tax=Naumannella halotolerans TaxID=993414 RepID=A0A4R7J1A4_9ACTN|nr:hypothetical protein [Naumannella halotolerans]TDT30880.1 hypothetical protein CLV29_2287 [Naumannella halotolerans]
MTGRAADEEGGVTFTDWDEYRDWLDEKGELAVTAYAALKKAGALKDHRLVAYRCGNRRRCLLLDVVNMPPPVGPIFHRPRYKLSPKVNAATSNDSGRAANTEDGDHKWKAQTFPPAQCLNVSLSCDHLQHVLVSKERIQADVDAGRREVIITPQDSESPPNASISRQ